MKFKKNITAKFLSGVLGLFIAVSVLLSCESNDDSSAFEIDKSVSLSTFSINGVAATINEGTGAVRVALPYNTEITALTPEVGIPEGATIVPDPNTPTDFTNEVEYLLNNGNLYKSYKVNVTVNKPILKFSINGISATINDNNQTVKLTVEPEADITNLIPQIEVSEGVSISPVSEVAQDFSEPVVYTVSIGGFSTEYTVNVSQQSTGTKIGFIGTAATREAIVDLDEVAASDWLFSTFSQVEYISLQNIANKDLAEFDVLWWHYDAAIELPQIAFNNGVINAFKDFRNNGGKLLLTTFATQYVEALGIVPGGEGPNNVFGDFGTNGFIADNNWGISYVGKEDHPIFQGLETFTQGKSYLLESGTFRQNHVSWWFLPDFGGYDNSENWRNATGGINLASEDFDDSLDFRVAIAEFPGSDSQGNVVVISLGAYDWYNENNANGDPSESNGFIGNIQLLTKNSLDYLTQ